MGWNTAFHGREMLTVIGIGSLGSFTDYNGLEENKKYKQRKYREKYGHDNLHENQPLLLIQDLMI